MTSAPGPLARWPELLPENVRRIVERDTPIPSIAARAAELQASRPDLVRADIGQISGFDAELETPYGQPVGLPRFRQSVAETWSLFLGLTDGRMPSLPEGLTAKNVTACTGAAEGLSLLFQCFARGKVVGLPRGHWENYTNGVELAGGRTVLVDFFDGDGRLDTDGLARAIREENIEVLVANFPCNPTGAVLDDEECRRLAGVIVDAGVVAIADEVYCRLRYDDHPPVSLLSHAPDHAVTVSSASKEYLAPGARVGYVISARADITDRVLRKLIRTNTASPNVLGQRAVLKLFDADLADLREGREPKILSGVRDEMKRRRDLLLEVLARHGFSTVGRAGRKPEGTIFLMASLPDWWSGSDAEFAEAALEAACVSTVPGSSFGLPGTIRLSYGGLDAAAIERLDANLTAFRERA